MSPATLGALGAASWLGGCWYVAPLLSSRAGPAPDAAGRARDAIVVGTAIPFVLALTALFTPPTCALTLAALIAVRSVVRPPLRLRSTQPEDARTRLGFALPLAAIVATAWPAIARPIMQGDSLLYHLPLAASMSVAHSAWTTVTSLWFYPCGSEMFAAALLQIGGPLEVGLGGVVASLLCGLRLMTFARRAGLDPMLGGAISAATMSVPLVALQGTSLENDVWLSAWLLEALWALTSERESGPSIRALAIASLIKPYGWLFAAAAIVAGRLNLRVAALAMVPLALWTSHDALLWRTALLDPHHRAFPFLQTTIVAHGWIGLTTFAGAIAAQGPGLMLLFASLLLTVIASRERTIRIVAGVSLAFFFVEPAAFADANPQLATGASLRYLFPALLAGVAGAMPFCARLNAHRTASSAAIAGLAGLTLWQMRAVTQIFAGDGNTHDAWAAGGAVFIAFVLPLAAARPLFVPALAAFLIARAGSLAGTHPLEYYDVAITRAGTPVSRFYEWLASTKPRVAVGYVERTGSLSVASPSSLVADGLGYDACSEARRLGGVLIALDDRPDVPGSYAQHRAYATACGRTIYEDDSAVVIEPSATSHPPQDR